MPTILEVSGISSDGCKIVCDDVSINSSVVMLLIQYRVTSESFVGSVDVSNGCQNAMLKGLKASTEYEVWFRLYTTEYPNGRVSESKIFKTTGKKLRSNFLCKMISHSMRFNWLRELSFLAFSGFQKTVTV